MSPMTNVKPADLLVRPEPEVLTFVGPDGTDLRSYLVELNQMYADNVVQRTKVAPVVHQLSKLYEEVNGGGASRGQIQALEHYAAMVPEYGVAVESRVPVMAYTERRSQTNRGPALEAISMLQGGLIFAAGAAAVFLLYKMCKWLYKVWTKDDKKVEKVASEAAKTAGALEQASTGDEVDGILSRINSNSERGPAVDLVHETFSKLVADFGSLPGGSERELGNVTKGMERYIDVASKLFDDAKSLATDVSADKGIDEAAVAKIQKLCEAYSKPLTAWPGFTGLLREYGVNIETRSLQAVGVDVEDVSGAVAKLKTAWENDSKKPALKSSKLAKNDMVIISRLLTAINKNLDPAAGFFPEQEKVAKEIGELTKRVEGLNNTYQSLSKEPKPDNAVNLAKLADLNDLCSVWGKLLTDYTSLVQFLLNRIGAFTSASTKFMTIYAETANKNAGGSATANA